MKFEKVSDAELNKYSLNSSDIRIPKRATVHSAGYDFYSPYGFTLEAGESIKIPTGIKCELDNDKFLAIYPRSSLGFKYKLQICNTVGIIDADYYGNADNGGHIFIKLFNDSPDGKRLEIIKGEAFAQGVIQRFYVADGDCTDSVRTGGIGSTNG